MKKALFTATAVFVLALTCICAYAAPDLQTLSGPHYIMDDAFSQIMTYNNMPVLSSWDVDNSGGSVTSSQGEEWFRITDESKTTRCRISKQLVSHDKGTIVYETSLKFANAARGTYLRISGEDGTKDAVRLDVQSSAIFYRTPAKAEKISAFKFNVFYPLKMYIDLDKKQTTVYFDGKKTGTYPFAEDVSDIDFIELGTADEYIATVYVNGMKMYTGFELNEQFFAVTPGELSEEWTVEKGSGVDVITERTYSASWPDMYCMKMGDNSSVASAKAERQFNGLSGHASFEFEYATEADGVAFSTSWRDGSKDIFTFDFADNNIVFNGKVLQSFVKNVWYSTIVEADFDTHTADIYINEILVAQDVSFSGEKVDTFCASTKIISRGQVWLDDIRAFAVNEPADEDYVPVPDVAESDDFVIGMQTCDMWREGFHLGYDYLNSHPDRIPLMGFYDEGSRAAADWETKMMVEHGIDFRMSCWFVPRNYSGGPIKMGANAFDMYEGYLRGKYSDMLDYAILWEGAQATMVDAENFKNYVVPFWVEHYFKDPRYLV
ncbi:MAG: hypothetical protein IJ365_08810, partial [Clostridia bacterium]|nr:hypothetical protein [Clostridia bacterium]